VSGPIVRKYGFANFEKIFGEREIQHGVEEGEADKAKSESPGPGLPPDLAHQPVDANQPSSSGQMSPATEFGSTGE
jgi:hypothetical protein